MRHGLSLRAAARRVGLPPSTLQGWFDGRHLPTLALQDQFVVLLHELGLGDESDAWLRVLDGLRGGGLVGTNPYQGIQPYAADDAERYFGRERALDDLVDKVRAVQTAGGARIVAVVGLSGAGKTSLLNAGLVGIECRGGGRLAEFACVTLSAQQVTEWVPGDTPTLLIVDHFEVLRNADEAHREGVLAALDALPANVTTVIGMVADAYGHALSDRRLQAALSAPVLLGPLTEQEFAQIIRLPAQRSGRPVDEALVALLQQDLRRYGPPPASVLPLLSNALFRAWDHASGQSVTVEDYVETGGLWGGLEHLAEEVFADSSAEEQERIRALLLSLVQVSADGFERRSIDMSAIAEEDLAFVDRFLSARLLSITGSSLVVSHSALLRQWGRLRSWAEEARDALLLRRRLSKAAEVWEESGRDPDTLVPVAALEPAAHGMALNHLEQDFLDASRAKEGERAAAHAGEIRKLRRLNALITALGAIVTVLLIIAVSSAARLEQVSSEAELAKAEAQSRQLALVAEEMRRGDRNVAAQVSVAAHRLSDTMEARAAVLKSAGEQVPTRILGPAGTVRVESAPGSALVASSSSDGVVRVWRNGQFAAPAAQFTVVDGQLFGLAFSLDQGREFLAVAGQGTASVWDVTGDEPRRLGEVGGDSVAYSAALGDGAAYFGMIDGTVRRMDLGDPEARLEAWSHPSGAAVQALAVSPADGSVVAGSDLILAHWTSDGEELPAVALSRWVNKAVFDPEGTSLVAVGGGGTTTLLTARPTGLELVTALEFGPLALHSVAVTEDRIVVGSGTGDVTVLDRDGSRLGSFVVPSTVTGIGFVEGRVVTGSLDGTVRVWPERYSGLLIEGSDTRQPAGVAGERIVKYFGETARVFDMDGELEREFDLPDGAQTDSTVIHASDETLTLWVGDGTLATWDLTRDGQPTLTDIGPGNAYFMGGSPDGRRALFAKASVPEALVLERDDLGWRVAGSFSTWSTLAMGWHPAEPMFAAMSEDSTRLVIWNAETLDKLGEVEVPSTGAAITLAWDPSGDRLFLGTDAGYILAVDVTDPARPAVAATDTELHSGISSLALAEDGELLAAGLVDGRIELWYVRDEGLEQAVTLRPGRGSVSQLVFDEGELIFLTDDEGIHTWPLDVDVAVERVCAAVGQSLTSHEWGHLAPSVDAPDGCG